MNRKSKRLGRNQAARPSLQIVAADIDPSRQSSPFNTRDSERVGTPQVGAGKAELVDSNNSIEPNHSCDMATSTSSPGGTEVRRTQAAETAGRTTIGSEVSLHAEGSQEVSIFANLKFPGIEIADEIPCRPDQSSVDDEQTEELPSESLLNRLDRRQNEVLAALDHLYNRIDVLISDLQKQREDSQAA